MTNKSEQTSYTRLPFESDVGETILRDVEACWRGLRDASGVPARRDLTPQPLVGALSHCFILERVTATVARFRVAGQSVHKLLEMEPRGLPLSSLFTASSRISLAPIINAVCEGPELAEIPVIASRGIARTPLRGRLLLLPLKDDDGAVTRIFGAIVVDGNRARRALRFDFDTNYPLRSQKIKPIIRTVHEVASLTEVLELPNTRHETPAKPASPRIPAEVTQQVWNAPGAAASKRPALRLVVDNT